MDKMYAINIQINLFISYILTRVALNNDSAKKFLNLLEENL